ncbi:MAG TPA: beta-galactosidase trimerization domain-containing protein, partial [Terriglobia bacterium]|nr:beta-galactosidase trimerization domain-containing protein [Terriglobia bacterium]
VHQAYGNYYYGAWQLLKDIGYDAEPFLDYQLTAEGLAKYRLVYVPNAPCLSEAQCSILAEYVDHGGTLLATHLTSLADEYGRRRNDYGLSKLFGATLASQEPVEIPDLYLRLLPSRRLIPQDPQVMLFKAGEGVEVLAETYSRGHRRTLGPAIIRRRQGRGQVIYIGSGLEAVYEETLNEDLRTYLRSLLDPILLPSRTYDVEFRPGLMAHFAASPNTLILHLLANTGNIWKKLLVDEEFLPVRNVRARIRLPQGRAAKSVATMWSGKTIPWSVRDGWVELTVPQVSIYEAIRVDLG